MPQRPVGIHQDEQFDEQTVGIGHRVRPEQIGDWGARAFRLGERQPCQPQLLLSAQLLDILESAGSKPHSASAAVASGSGLGPPTEPRTLRRRKALNPFTAVDVLFRA